MQHAGEFLLRSVESGLTNLHFAADIDHRHLAFGLVHGKPYLLFDEAFSFNDWSPFRLQNSVHLFSIQLVQLLGERPPQRKLGFEVGHRLQFF